jgi:hypothetical protein
MRLLDVPPTIPIDIGRDEAAAAARRELADPIYAPARPSWFQQAVRWVLEHLLRLFDSAAGLTPGGYGGLVVVVVLLVLAVVVIRWRIGAVARTARGPEALFEGGPRSAAEHRRDADAFAARGEWAEALRARLRAIVRGLEERALLDVRPGRTAHEAATEAGVALPDRADDLRRAATMFDDVWYGGRDATAEMDAWMRTVDESVARARVVV